MNEIDSEDQFGRPEFSRVMGWITPLLATAIGGSVWPPPSGSGTPPFDTHEASPRTPPTRKVSHFARNQPGGVRPSSASPPSPHSPCLTGILTVLRHFGSGYVKARSSMVRSGARRQGSRGRSLRDLTSRCSGRGRLRPSVFHGLESRPRS